MALANMGFKIPKLVSFGGRRTNRMGRRRREEEEEEEEERKRKRRSSNKGMETTLSMDFVWITWNLRLDMVNLLSLNLGF